MKAEPISLKNIKIESPFWNDRINKIRKTVIPYQWELLNDRVKDAAKSGAVQNFKIAAGKAKGEFYGCSFQDSDLAKWLESVAYSLTTNPDNKLERIADELIDLIADAQDENGYLVTKYLIHKDEKRFSNLRDDHELYVMGHMIEAAVAYFEATGKDKFLNVMKQAADHINEVFGKGKGKIKGYPGHEEVELALVKLYRITDKNVYLRLSQYFINERGRQPYYFVNESINRGVSPDCPWGDAGQEYWQSHLPVRDQKTAEGHAVRAMYLYSAMADISSETGEKELQRACRRLWNNVITRRMYVTGGVGSSHDGERFTSDCDLPNDTAYAETCAAIGLVFFAHRMLNLEINREYADVMERALYNGVMSGISLDGKEYFYVNPLAVNPDLIKKGFHKRQSWYGCACCPPNISRLFTSLGKYIYSKTGNKIYTHLFVGSKAEFELNNHKVVIEQKTDYPWKEKIQFDIQLGQAFEFTFSVRMPEWCRSPKIKVNNVAISVDSILKKGYAEIKRIWKNGDKVEMILPMPIEEIESNPNVFNNAGRIALQRGPIVYCIEQVDNGKNLNEIIVSKKSKLQLKYDRKLLGGLPVIEGKGFRRDEADWKNKLYRSDSSRLVPVNIKAIPYAFWANRKAGEMLVWIRHSEY
jgi:uncharacterized protein